MIIGLCECILSLQLYANICPLHQLSKTVKSLQAADPQGGGGRVRKASVMTKAAEEMSRAVDANLSVHEASLSSIPEEAHSPDERTGAAAAGGGDPAPLVLSPSSSLSPNNNNSNQSAAAPAVSADNSSATRSLQSSDAASEERTRRGGQLNNQNMAISNILGEIFTNSGKPSEESPKKDRKV